MMRKRFLFSLASVLLLSTLLLSGCNSGKSTEGSGKVTLTFGTSQSGIPRTGIMQTMAKEYEQETGVKIDFQVVPDAQWRDLIKVKLASGEAPDIFNVDVDPLSMPANVRPEENAIDLTNEEFTGRMSEEILPTVSHNDKVYGVSFAPTKIWYVYYNKRIFQELSIEPPTSYAEFKAISQKIKDKDIIPFYQAPASGWYQVLPLFETGPNYEQTTAGTYEKLNNNEMKVADMTQLKTVIEQLKEFADLGYFGKDFFIQYGRSGH